MAANLILNKHMRLCTPMLLQAAREAVCATECSEDVRDSVWQLLLTEWPLSEFVKMRVFLLKIIMFAQNSYFFC